MQNLHKAIALTAISLLIYACSENKTAHSGSKLPALPNVTVVDLNDPLFEFSFNEVYRIDQVKEEHIKGLWGLNIDHNEKLYWRDNQLGQVHQYGTGGEYIRSFGGKGRGPGEFVSLKASDVHLNRLVMLDYVTALVHIFNTESGDLVSSVNLKEDLLEQPQVIFQDVYNTGGNHFVVQDAYNYIQKQDSLVLLKFSNQITEKIDTLYKFPISEALSGSTGSGSFRSSARFMAKSLVQFFPDGRFVYSFGRKPLFFFYDTEGNYQKAIFFRYSAAELQKDHIQHEIENSNEMIDLGRSVKNADWIPGNWPVWNRFLTDPDGNLWIELNSAPPHQNEWVVISEDGEFLARFELDQSSIRAVGSGYLYTSNRIDGVFEVVKYRVEKNRR